MEDEDQEIESLSSRVFWRAWTDTLRTFEAKKRTILVGCSLLVVGLAVHVIRDGAASMTVDIGQTVLDSVVPVLIVGIGVFTWHLWLAPFTLTSSRSGVVQSVVSNTQIDWKPWRIRTEYTLSEFSRILACLDPTSPESDGNSRTYYELLKEALTTGRVKYIPSERAGYLTNVKGSVTGGARIKRKDALVWAKKNNLNVSHVDDPTDLSPLFKP